MGAIQQAFNQALSIGALAASPTAAMKNKIETAAKESKEAQTIQEKLQEPKTLAEVSAAEEANRQTLAKFEKEAQLNPTEENIAKLGEMRSIVQEQEYAAAQGAPTFKAKEALVQQQTTYADQEANMQKLKSLKQQRKESIQQTRHLKWEIKKEARK